MALTNELISQFVKATRDKDNTKTDKTVYGTVVVEYDGSKWVKIDGSDLLTPISFTTRADNNERVMVSLKNHTATVVGNVSSPSLNTRDKKETDDKIGSVISDFEVIVADKVSTKDFEATNANIEELQADNVNIHGVLNANAASIKNLESDNIIVKGQLDAVNANIENLEATNVTINGDLQAMRADIGSLVTENATITGELSAARADIIELKADNAEITGTLSANSAEIINLKAKTAKIEHLDAEYANIGFTNIGTASIDNLYSKFAFLENFVAKDGVYTGNLVAVRIDGDSINVNSLKADRLMVKGKDGLYYKLNVTDGGVDPEKLSEKDQLALQNGLHGSNIIASTVTADKVSVSDLYAFEATIGGFVIDEDSIHSSVKTTVDNTTRGIYLDNDGQMNVGDAFNYVKYHKDDDGSYKLDISADSIKIGGTVAHAVRRLDGPVNQLECVGDQGIRVVSNFEYTQEGSGDPSPSNIRKITGMTSANMTRCGKNLIDISSMYASTKSAIDYSDNTIRVYSTEDGTYRAAHTKPMILRNGVRYTLSVTVTDIPGGFVRVGFRRRSNNSFITNTYATFSEVGSKTVTFKPTADLDVYFSIMVTSSTSAAGDATLANIQFEIADEATTYEAFSGEHYEVEFDETVYGGSFEWSSGTFSVDTEVLSFDGTEAWTFYSNATYPYWYLNIDDYGSVVDKSSAYTCSHFGNVTINSSTNNIGVAVYNSATANIARVAFRPGIAGITDLASWIAYLKTQHDAGTPVQVCYRVVDPRKIRVEPSQVESLDGLNTVYTDIPNGYMEFGIGSLSSLGGATQYDVDRKANTDDVDIIIDRVNTAEQSINSLEGTIKTLVTGTNGESLMTQTDTGWTFSMKQILESIDGTKKDVKELTDANFGNAINQLNKSVAALGESAEYVNVITYNDQPCLALGETDSDFKLLITNTDIRFMEGTDNPASVTNNSLHINKAVIEDELSHGGFVWKSRKNGNWGILWKGE